MNAAQFENELTDAISPYCNGLVPVSQMVAKLRKSEYGKLAKRQQAEGASEMVIRNLLKRAVIDELGLEN